MDFSIQKDGKGGIIMSEDSFKMLLKIFEEKKYMYLDNVATATISSRGNNKQNAIDDYINICKETLYQKFVCEIQDEDKFLYKRYENQIDYYEWTMKDLILINGVFNENNSISKPLIGRSNHHTRCLTISDNRFINRAWTEDEINKVQNIINDENNLTTDV